MTREKKITVAASVISFLVGVLLGPGVIWNYAEYQRDTSRLELEKTIAVSQLSAKLNELYDEIVSLSDEYIRAFSDYHINDDQQSLQEMGEAKVKLATLKDAYGAVESQLARILERDPRQLQIDFIPPAPLVDFEMLEMEVVQPKQ